MTKHRLGTVRHYFDADGHHCRERLGALADCPKCGQEIELYQDTEAWVQADDVHWLVVEGESDHAKSGCTCVPGKTWRWKLEKIQEATK